MLSEYNSPFTPSTRPQIETARESAQEEGNAIKVIVSASELKGKIKKKLNIRTQSFHDADSKRKKSRLEDVCDLAMSTFKR